MLNYVETGAGAPVLVIAHGLFGSARNWGVIAKRLGAGRRVIAVDMRNHGASPWFDSHGYPEMAADLAEVIATAAAGGPCDVLGHSMGGKAAMMLALERPDLLRKLIVADIAPVAYGHSQQVYIDAMRAVDPATVGTRAQADAALAAEVEDPGVRAFLLQSLDLKAGAWRLNLDVLEREMDRIVGWPEVTGRFEGPTLFLSGGASDYVRTADRARVREIFPKARFAAIPGAGHWLHAEKPREFEAAVAAWLAA